MTRLLLVLLLAMFAAAPPARAEEAPKPDDKVVFEISAEDWITTKTARVVVSVEAAVNAENAGSMRTTMIKAVNDLAKADWRLTSFNRSQDQTGLEHWSVMFEARMPESELNSLAEDAKKASKAGMQFNISDMDFSPTLEEREAARAALRVEIYKNANEQLAALNSALPGRTYRIATIAFADSSGTIPMMDNRAEAKFSTMQARGGMAPTMPGPSMERAEKATLTARIIYAALPPAEVKK